MEKEKLNKPMQQQGVTTGFPRLLGERLCLNYVNTIDGRISERPEEFLTRYSALAGWGRYAGVLEEEEEEQLISQALLQPDQAATVLAEAIALREALYRIFVAVAHRRLPEPGDLNLLKQAYLHALQHADMGPVSDRYGWMWRLEKEVLDRMLWPVIESAVELLTSTELERVKQCPGWDDCGWLFFDTSKNGTRQWCSMEGCGSRVKMRRQYARQRTHKKEG